MPAMRRLPGHRVLVDCGSPRSPAAAGLDGGILAHGCLRLRCGACGHDKLAAPLKLLTPVLQVVHRVITRQVPGRPGLKGIEADSGAIPVIQRFGSAVNLNIHRLRLVLNRMDRRGASGVPEFVAVPAPIDDALQSVLHKTIAPMMK